MGVVCRWVLSIQQRQTTKESGETHTGTGAPRSAGPAAKEGSRRVQPEINGKLCGEGEQSGARSKRRLGYHWLGKVGTRVSLQRENNECGNQKEKKMSLKY